MAGSNLKTKIIDSLLDTLNFDARIRDVRQGPFQTAVLSRYCGLAATPHESGSHHGKAPVNEAGFLMDKSVLELAEMAKSPNSYEAAIGMATINSLMEIDNNRCIELNAGDLLAERGRGKTVTLIGHFPFVPKLRQVARELWVIERQPQAGDLPENEAEKYIPVAEVIGITGTAFTNHTIEYLLGLCAPDAFVIVLGGTTPLSSALFAYGVDAVSGARVVESETVMRGVSQGATFRQIKGLKLLTMMR
jgi:uncharacterized protein (DUF4213/DUF364 family)